MDAVVLGALAGALFGLLAVTVRRGLRGGGGDPAVGTVVIVAIATLAAATASLPVIGDADAGELWPFLAIGVLVPGVSQVLFVLAVRDAGPSRAAILIGTAPLISVTLALALLDEPFRPALLLATALVVAGGAVLAAEQVRPASFRRIGIAFGVACAVLYAVRDNVVRWAAQELGPPPALAAAVSLLGALLFVTAYVALGHRAAVRAGLGPAARVFAPAGVVLGVAYVSLVVAFDRGRVGVVAPLNATQSLWAVAFAAVLVGRDEAIGRHTVLAAALVVAGGVLIGVLR